MIDPSILQSAIGTVIMTVMTFMLRAFHHEEKKSRRMWEVRVEDNIARLEKITGALRIEFERERRQRADMTEKILSLMQSLTTTKDAMSGLAKAFSGYVSSSDQRIIKLESHTSEIIALSKHLRLIRDKKA